MGSDRGEKQREREIDKKKREREREIRGKMSLVYSLWQGRLSWLFLIVY